MDSGELDFYQHTKVCSNTCRSTKIDLVGTKVSISSEQSAELVPATPSSADCEFHSLNHCTSSGCSLADLCLFNQGYTDMSAEI